MPDVLKAKNAPRECAQMRKEYCYEKSVTRIWHAKWTCPICSILDNICLTVLYPEEALQMDFHHVPLTHYFYTHQEFHNFHPRCQVHLPLVP